MMKEFEYAEEEIKHFSDLIDGMALDEDQKHQLLRYIKMEIISAYRAGQEDIKKRMESFGNIDIEWKD